MIVAAAGSMATTASPAERSPVSRAQPRRKVFSPAWLDTADGRHRAHILNLSTIGACVHARCAHRVWSQITLHVGDHAMAARITWADGERCGVKFIRPLNAREMDAVIG